jgi:hypothetical protein
VTSFSNPTAGSRVAAGNAWTGCLSSTSATSRWSWTSIARTTTTIGDSIRISRGDPNVGYGDLVWDCLGAIPDVGAWGSDLQAARYLSKARIAGKGRMGVGRRSTTLELPLLLARRWGSLHFVEVGSLPAGLRHDAHWQGM